MVFSCGLVLWDNLTTSLKFFIVFMLLALFLRLFETDSVRFPEEIRSMCDNINSLLFSFNESWPSKYSLPTSFLLEPSSLFDNKASREESRGRGVSIYSRAAVDFLSLRPVTMHQVAHHCLSTRYLFELNDLLCCKF